MSSMRSFAVLLMALLLALMASMSRPGAPLRARAETGTLAYLPAISRNFAPGIAPYAAGLPEPANVTSLVDPGDGRMFVVMKDGRVLVVSNEGELQPEPLLDIRGTVQAWPFEAGLLGLAVHPDFANNGYIYVNYTDGTKTEIASNLVRFTVGSDGLADPDSALTLLRFPQPGLIHQGGDLKFGPHDGYLYVAIGDGGTPNMITDDSQSKKSMLGKILRIDVDSGTPYAVPQDNPYVSDPQKLGEIWALGLRNPWRISFDQVTGDMFIGEVGQATWEEVNRIPAGIGGLNFGWPCYEANDPFFPKYCSSSEILTPPIYAYIHEQTQYHCSITGGFVYRGQRIPELAGDYLFADYCAGDLWSLRTDGTGLWEATNWGDMGHRWSTFGERSDGELFLGAVGSATVFQIVPDGMSSTLPEINESLSE